MILIIENVTVFNFQFKNSICFTRINNQIFKKFIIIIIIMFFFQVPDEPLYMATATGTKIFPNQTLDTEQVKGTKTFGVVGFEENVCALSTNQKFNFLKRFLNIFFQQKIFFHSIFIQLLKRPYFKWNADPDALYTLLIEDNDIVLRQVTSVIKSRK